MYTVGVHNSNKIIKGQCAFQQGEKKSVKSGTGSLHEEETALRMV